MSYNIKGVYPKYKDEEAHLVRRLGFGVALLWNAIPKETQQLILKQASLVADKTQTVQLIQQIEGFAEENALDL